MYGTNFNSDRQPVIGGARLTDLDAALLAFVAEMYGVQLDQLAALLADRGEPADRAGDSARELVTRWRAAGLAETGQLSVGEPWVWATRKALHGTGDSNGGAGPGADPFWWGRELVAVTVRAILPAAGPQSEPNSAGARSLSCTGQPRCLRVS